MAVHKSSEPDCVITSCVAVVLLIGCCLDGTNKCLKNGAAEVCTCSTDLCNLSSRTRAASPPCCWPQQQPCSQADTGQQQPCDSDRSVAISDRPEVQQHNTGHGARAAPSSGDTASYITAHLYLSVSLLSYLACQCSLELLQGTFGSLSNCLVAARGEPGTRRLEQELPSPWPGLSEELSKAHSDKFAVVLLSLASESSLGLHFAGVAAFSQFWGENCRFVLSQEELFGFTTISNQSYHKSPTILRIQHFGRLALSMKMNLY